MTEPTWWSYFKRIAGTETGRVIAEAAQVSEPQVSRWKSGKNRPDAEALVRFARHYKRPPVEAIVAAGYLAVSDITSAIEVVRPLSDLTDDELLAEVLRRMKGATDADRTDRTDPPTKAARTPNKEGPSEKTGEVRRLADRPRKPPAMPEAPVFDPATMAARRRPGRKGPDPRGLDDGQE